MISIFNEPALGNQIKYEDELAARGRRKGVASEEEAHLALFIGLI